MIPRYLVNHTSEELVTLNMLALSNGSFSVSPFTGYSFTGYSVFFVGIGLID